MGVADDPVELLARWRAARAHTLAAFAGRPADERVPRGRRRIHRCRSKAIWLVAPSSWPRHFRERGSKANRFAGRGFLARLRPVQPELGAKAEDYDPAHGG